MYDLFDTFFNPWYDDSEYNKKAPKQQAPQNTQNLMKTDIRELADGYELQMELPGYKKEEVQAALHKGYLTISAAKSAEETVEGKYLRRERYIGSCQRSFYVGEYLRQEDIRASFQNGILTLFVPKDKDRRKEIYYHCVILYKYPLIFEPLQVFFLRRLFSRHNSFFRRNKTLYTGIEASGND